MPISLAHRLLHWIAQTSSRTDVTVQRQTPSWGGSLGVWKKALPADMFEFYDALNGLCFFYTVKGDEAWHGFHIMALEKGSRHVVDTRRRSHSLPHQAAGRYPEYFFHEETAPKEEEDVLFFMGDDSTWGVVMIGGREDPAFYKWNNDGFLTYATDSFTTLIEHGLAQDFAHTWACTCPEDAEPIPGILAKPVPTHHTFDVLVTDLKKLDGQGWRRHLGQGMSAQAFGAVMKATGRSERFRGTTEHERGELVDAACGPLADVDTKGIKAIMTALGKGKKTKKGFAQHFRHDEPPVWRVCLEITHVGGPLHLSENEETAMRACACVPELAVLFERSEVPPMIRASAHLRKAGYGSRQGFLAVGYSGWAKHPDFERGKDMRHLGKSCALWVVVEQEPLGVKSGQRYASSALPRVQEEMGA